MTAVEDALTAELDAEPVTPKRRTKAQPMHATLAEALAAAQAEMPAVKPDAFNPHFKSAFVSLGHLIAVTRPVLNRHGLAITQMPGRGDDGMPVLWTIITHVSGETLERDAPLLPLKNDMQSLGAAITYMRRFAWASACAISDQSDDDGESIADRVQNTRQEAAGAPRTPAQRQDSPGDTQNVTGPGNALVFMSGKHKGSTLEHVLQTDRGYVEWCAENWKEPGLREACIVALGDTIAAALASEFEQPPLLDDDIPFG